MLLSSAPTIAPLTDHLMSGSEWARAATTLALWMALPVLVGMWRIAPRGGSLTGERLVPRPVAVIRTMAARASRRIIAALQVSLDGLIEGPNAEVDWIESWEDSFDLLPEIDTCVLGGGMYPGYEEYWLAVLADPEGVLPLTGKVPSKGEREYARFADETPHVVLSTTLDSVEWSTARIVRDVEAIAALKEQPGKHIHAVGGASLVASLMNEGLVDELRLTVHPIVLGRGKALFGHVTRRRRLEVVEAKPLTHGRVSLAYRTTA